MGCNRVNGYLSLGLMLYLLTFTYDGVVGNDILSGECAKKGMYCYPGPTCKITRC